MQEIFAQFKPELLALLVVAVFFVLLYFIGIVANALAKTQWYTQNQLFIGAIAQKALELILHTEYGDEYESVSEEYDVKAQQRAEKGDFYIDPRMLFVIDKLETYVNKTFGQKLEFDDLLQIAETKYREVKHDETNTLLN